MVLKFNIIVQFPNIFPSTTKFIIVNVQPHPVQRPFWQVSLFHLPPKFSVTFKFTITGPGMEFGNCTNFNEYALARKITALVSVPIS